MLYLQVCPQQLCINELTLPLNIYIYIYTYLYIYMYFCGLLWYSVLF